ncbi:MAG: nitroreductase family protein [Planctomycetaceae bacterium]|nr:nitroreductase family protein [Planctomycetaceae bacterium]
MASLLSFDDAVCTRCGKCGSACPMGFIRVGSRGPRTVPDAQEKCMLCGHCIAACATKTLQHERLAPEACLPLDENWRGDVHAVEQLIKGRRSIRRYEDRPVDRATLLKVIDMARYAPTGMNSQSVSWLVVYKAGEVKKLSAAVIDWMRSLAAKGELIGGNYNPAPMIMAWDNGTDLILRGCPHVLVAYAREGDAMAAGSCTAALTTAELAAATLGLGTCWAGFLHMAMIFSPAAREVLALPAGHVMHGALMIGHPAEQYHRIPPRKEPDVQWR